MTRNDTKLADGRNHHQANLFYAVLLNQGRVVKLADDDDAAMKQTTGIKEKGRTEFNSIRPVLPLGTR